MNRGGTVVVPVGSSGQGAGDEFGIHLRLQHSVDKGEGLLKNAAVLVLRVLAAAIAEVTQAVKDQFSLIQPRGLQYMRMVAHHQIIADIDQLIAHQSLIDGELRLVIQTPVDTGDDQLAALSPQVFVALFQPCHHALAVINLIDGHKADPDALDLTDQITAVVAVADAGIGQHLLRFHAAGNIVVQPVIVSHGGNLHGRSGENGHIFRRSFVIPGLFHQLGGVGQRSFQVDHR